MLLCTARRQVELYVTRPTGSLRKRALRYCCECLTAAALQLVTREHSSQLGRVYTTTSMVGPCRGRKPKYLDAPLVAYRHGVCVVAAAVMEDLLMQPSPMTVPPAVHGVLPGLALWRALCGSREGPDPIHMDYAPLINMKRRFLFFCGRTACCCVFGCVSTDK